MPIVNFYHTDAIMKGTDYHDFIIIAPPPLGSLTLSNYGYTVFCDHKSGSKIVSTVTSAGKHMIQQGNNVSDGFHLAGIPAPAHPIKQTKNQREINKNASSKAQMCVASVSGQRTPLACCIENAAGANINCTDLPVRTNVVKSVNSVRTRPTKLDYYVAFNDQFIEEHEIPKFIKDSPGTLPKHPPRKSTSERLKRSWEQMKREFNQYWQFVPKK